MSFLFKFFDYDKFLHLAGDCERETLDELDILGDLEVRDSTLTKGEDIVVF